jgi:hypothetical protein
MAIHVPNVPRRPPGGSGRGSFWRGFFAAIGIVFILYLSLCTFLSMKYPAVEGLSEVGEACDLGDYWIEVDGTKYTIQPGEAREFKIQSGRFGYGCGSPNGILYSTCGSHTVSLAISRFSDPDRIYIRCEVANLGGQWDSGHGLTIFEHDRPIPSK